MVAVSKIFRLVDIALALWRGQLFLFPSLNIKLLRIYGKVTCRGSKRNIRFGDQVTFLGDATLVCGINLDGDLIDLGDGVIIEQGGYINSHGGAVIIGKHTFVGVGCVIQGKGVVKIGMNTLLGPYVQIYSSDHPTESSNVLRRLREEESKSIEIGEDTWIGAGSIILKGSSIKCGSVVAAGSVVRANLGKCALYGSQARLVDVIREL
jgi:acetyltransferase-like isoleucine patch superfamily enzyme